MSQNVTDISKAPCPYLRLFNLDYWTMTTAQLDIEPHLLTNSLRGLIAHLLCHKCFPTTPNATIHENSFSQIRSVVLVFYGSERSTTLGANLSQSQSGHVVTMPTEEPSDDGMRMGEMVDPHLKVFTVRGARDVDASVFLLIPREDTQSSC